MAKPDPLRDIAYRLMSRGSKESRDLKAIDRAIQEYYYKMPYTQAYTGSFQWPDYTPDPNRDLNHLFLYGNAKGQYVPVPATELRGETHNDVISKHYPNKTVRSYYGNFFPVKQVELPIQAKPLVNYLAAQKFSTGHANLDFRNEEEFKQAMAEQPTVDDFGSSLDTRVGYSPNGNPEFQMSDLWDFSAGYGKKWGWLAGLQGAALNAVGNPVILRQYIPIVYTNNEENSNEHGIRTLFQIAKDHDVATHDKATDTYHMVGHPYEIEVTPANTSVYGPKGKSVTVNYFDYFK